MKKAGVIEFAVADWVPFIMAVFKNAEAPVFVSAVTGKLL